jgi:hypothetical protein
VEIGEERKYISDSKSVRRESKGLGRELGGLEGSQSLDGLLGVYTQD